MTLTDLVESASNNSNIKTLSKLYTALEYLGYSFEGYFMSKYVRMELQGLVYAMHLGGIYFGYRFENRVSGLFSYTLSVDGEYIAANYEKLKIEHPFVLNKAYTQRLDILKTCLILTGVNNEK